MIFLQRARPILLYSGGTVVPKILVFFEKYTGKFLGEIKGLEFQLGGINYRLIIRFKVAVATFAAVRVPIKNEYRRQPIARFYSL